MNYQKPLLNLVSSATASIEGVDKPPSKILDSVDLTTFTTPSAYEADE